MEPGGLDRFYRGAGGDGSGATPQGSRGFILAAGVIALFLILYATGLLPAHSWPA